MFGILTFVALEPCPALTELLSTKPSHATQSPDLGIRATHYISEWEANSLVPNTEERVEGRMVVGPPRQVRPGSTWYYPVEREFYDAEGNSLWSAVGQLEDPTDPSVSASDPDASLILTYYDRNEQGQARHTVMDASPGDIPDPLSPGNDVTVPAFPTVGTVSWARIPSAAGLNYMTSFGYDIGAPGLSDTHFPSGRRWARRVIKVIDPEDPQGLKVIAREYVFNNLEPVTGGFVTQSPGEVKDYYGEDVYSGVKRTRRVEFTATELSPIPDLSFNSTNEPGWKELWEIAIAPDSNGRLRKAALLEPDPTGAMLAVGSKEVNDLGEVHREREIDGTTTRRTKDSVGQVLRTYVGTEDINWPDYPTTGGFDMVLTERVEYGSGAHNAWMPTIVRTYDSMPDWHVPIGSMTGSGTVGYYDDPPSNDPDGVATVTGYDWRMRPVRVDSYAKGDPATAARLSTTLTYLDHADRPRLVVTFGAGTLDGATPDPTTFDPPTSGMDEIPDPADFYQLSLKPTSITESFYGPDGTMTERRTYDAAWTYQAGVTPPYHAEYTYSGKGGQQVYSQRPGGPIVVTELDGVGRVASSKTILPGTAKELSRTDYTYDTDGNVVDTATWTRVVDDTTDALSSSNAVRSRTVSWYDVEKRVIATAELGTELGVFAPNTGTVYDRVNNPTAPSAVPGVINRQGLPAEAQLWIYQYDRKGNQVLSVDPAGRATKYTYSQAGRLIEKAENEWDHDVSMIRRTAYDHKYGRLTRIIADRANMVGAEAQQTEVVYGAEVVDASGNTMSASNALIGKLWFPPVEGGAPDPQDPPDISLRYTFQGQIAEREDARGAVFRYGYDDLGRLASVEVGHRSGGNFVAGYPSSMTPSIGDPVDRVGYVEYEYDDAGNLELVTNWDKKDPGTRLLIAQDEYDYDDRGSLLTEWQSIGAPQHRPRVVLGRLGVGVEFGSKLTRWRSRACRRTSRAPGCRSSSTPVSYAWSKPMTPKINWGLIRDVVAPFRKNRRSGIRARRSGSFGSVVASEEFLLLPGHSVRNAQLSYMDLIRTTLSDSIR